METEFDIRDASNRYEPCLRCRSVLNIGLVTRRGMVAVECMDCGFRGQHFPVDPAHPIAQDKAAFDAWNALGRS